MDKYNSLSTKKKIYRSKELSKLGLTYYRINKLIEKGNLTKLNKSNYENNNYDGDENDFYYVDAYAHAGVVSLMSAAVHYGLTTYRPDSIEVAIPKNKNITTLPDWPVINLFYFEGYRYNLGIEEIWNGENHFKIYDIEKTVIDIIYYRNKIGIEETKEVLTNYLKRSDRDLNKLIRYADKLKCKDILNTYLEVLL
jgi:predicted transcriptional regulator of viral defense system